MNPLLTSKIIQNMYGNTCEGSTISWPKLDDPYFELFTWATLLNRKELALYFLEQSRVRILSQMQLLIIALNLLQNFLKP